MSKPYTESKYNMLFEVQNFVKCCTCDDETAINMIKARFNKNFQQYSIFAWGINNFIYDFPEKINDIELLICLYANNNILYLNFDKITKETFDELLRILTAYNGSKFDYLRTMVACKYFDVNTLLYINPNIDIQNKIILELNKKNSFSYDLTEYLLENNWELDWITITNKIANNYIDMRYIELLVRHKLIKSNAFMVNLITNKFITVEMIDYIYNNDVSPLKFTYNSELMRYYGNKEVTKYMINKHLEYLENLD